MEIRRGIKDLIESALADPKAGETIVVTGAAGSVGSLVGQLAKADGLHVIGVAGDDDACQ